MALSVLDVDVCCVAGVCWAGWEACVLLPEDAELEPLPDVYDEPPLLYPPEPPEYPELWPDPDVLFSLQFFSLASLSFFTDPQCLLLAVYTSIYGTLYVQGPLCSSFQLSAQLEVIAPEPGQLVIPNELQYPSFS